MFSTKYFSENSTLKILKKRKPINKKNLLIKKSNNNPDFKNL